MRRSAYQKRSAAPPACRLGPLALLLALCCGSAAWAQAPTLKPGYYAVIESYRPAHMAYAQAQAARLYRRGVFPLLGIDSLRGYLHIYTRRYAALDAALREIYRLRRSADFPSAWVRVIAPPLTASAPAPPPTLPPPAAALPAPAAPRPLPPDTVRVALLPEGDAHAQPLQGEIEVIDADRMRSVARMASGRAFALPALEGSSGRIVLKAHAFGYKPAQTTLHARLTPADAAQPFISREASCYRVELRLARYQPGDTYPMEDVYFYTDAAIMMPESEAQLRALKDMMERASSCVIRLHGHTNGKRSGALITPGPSGRFFEIAPDSRRSFGSAQRLSRERALAIKQWLVAQGIAPARVSIKAWGGRVMLYDQNRANAYKNLRVEVEIIHY